MMKALNHVPLALRPARDPQRPLSNTRVLSAAHGVLPVEAVAALFEPGDVLVLNNASTLPASLHGRTGGDAAVELRLLPNREPFAKVRDVVLFGSGDWRTDTDRRPAPPSLALGDRIHFAGGESAVVRAEHALSERWLSVEFETDDMAEFLFEAAAPVQYAHLERPLRLSEVQTPYGGPAWAVEMPSTGRPLSFALLQAIEARGAQVAWLTHGAGLSATGDPRIDRQLPFPERYAIPEPTVRAIEGAERVIAVGTTVVRALESAAEHGPLHAGEGIATLVLGPNTPLRVVSAILTGMHSPGESHWELLRAFADDHVLYALHARATRKGLLAHEFGDLLFLSRASRREGQRGSSLLLERAF
ncbi:MAG: S-adenosylmethionine:tRNA ribosyltransferase-isomerase [Myxococcota bacterium]